jgi:hypothetical protein
MITILLVLFFLTAAALHIYWAAGGKQWLDAALPQQEGRPVFRPSRSMTLGVGLALLVMAATVLWNAGAVSLPWPRTGARIAMHVAFAIFFLRTIGDFRTFGLFKRKADTTFARFDTRLYTPLCAVISLGLWWLAWG